MHVIDLLYVIGLFAYELLMILFLNLFLRHEKNNPKSNMFLVYCHCIIFHRISTNLKTPSEKHWVTPPPPPHLAGGVHLRTE